MIFNKFMKLFISIFLIFYSVLKSYAIDPYSEYYGSEYTEECNNFAEAVISGLQSHDEVLINNTLSDINKRLSKLTIGDRAKLYQKFRRIYKKKIKSLSDEIDSYARQIIPTLHASSLFDIYATEAENYNRELYRKEKEEKNKVNILPTDRTIKYYSLPPSKAIHAINGEEYTTDDLKPSGKVLISKGGLIKAFTISSGWRRIISYKREPIAPGWSQIDFTYYEFGYSERDGDPSLFFIIKDSDLR